MVEAQLASACSECQGRLHIREIVDHVIHDRQGNPKTIKKVVWRRCDCVEAKLEAERLGPFYTVKGECPQAAPYLQRENIWFICPKIETVKQIIRDRLLLNKRRYLYMSVADLVFDRVKTDEGEAISKSAGYYEFPQFFLTLGYDEEGTKEFMLQLAKEVMSLRSSHGQGTWFFTPKPVDGMRIKHPFVKILKGMTFFDVVKFG